MLSWKRFGKQTRKAVPLVLLHGWGGSWLSWQPLIKQLEKKHAGYAVDLPGFGASPLTQPMDLQKYADTIRHWLLAQGYSSCILIGHSFGGAIGITLASSHPELVKKLVLIDSSGIRPQREPHQEVVRLIARSGRAVFLLPGLRRFFPRVRKKFYSLGLLKGSDYAELSQENMKKTFTNIVDQDVSDLCVKVGCPTLLIWGTQDKDTPFWHGERMHALIPQSRLIPMEGAGHFSYLDRTDDVIKELKAFL